jgi:hypothetical protein
MSADGHRAAHGTRSRSGEFGTRWKHHRVSVDSRPSGAGSMHLQILSDQPEQITGLEISVIWPNFAERQSLEVPDLPVDLTICRRFYGAKALYGFGFGRALCLKGIP